MCAHFEEQTGIDLSHCSLRRIITPIAALGHDARLKIFSSDYGCMVVRDLAWAFSLSEWLTRRA